MSAILKLRHIKDNLTDVFEREKSGLEIEIHPSEFQNSPGFISSSYDEMITIEEFKSRKDELQSIRPDLVEYFWPLEDECILDFWDNPITTVLNPFVTTCTRSFEFDTLENLKSAVLNAVQNFPAEELSKAKEDRKTIKNRIQDAVIEDGVDITQSLDWFVALAPDKE